MDPILGFLFIAGLLWAGKQAAEHVGREFRKSPAAQGGPRHAAAWWGSEARHGFPVTRTGFQSGWLAHQTAMAQRQAQREEAKTSHLEARASIARELAAHRQRQAEAQARIDAAHAAAAERYTNARRALNQNAINDHARGIDSETPEFLRLNREVAEAEQGLSRGERARIDSGVLREQDYWNRMKQPVDDELAARRATRRVDGKPETEADKRFFDERESGYDGPLNQDGRGPGMNDPQQREAVATLDGMRGNGHKHFPNGNQPCDCGMPACRSGFPEDSTVPSSQNGAGSMATATDGNYTRVLTAANTQSAQADYAAADVRGQREAAEQILEEMQSVDVDSATLSDQADHVARLRAAEQALEAVTESGAQVSSGLGQRHGGLKEAHDDAPVRAAERGFYEE